MPDVTQIVVLTALVGLVLGVYQWLVKNRNYWKNRGIPTVKSSVPYIENMWPLLSGQKSMGDMYTDIYRATPNCSMVGLTMCGAKELLVRDPDLVKTILLTHFSNFGKNGFQIDAKLDPLISLNPFFNSGDEWKRQRAVLTNGMSTAKLKNMAQAVREVCSKFLAYVKRQVDLHNGTYEVEAQELFSRFTAEVVASAGFGVEGRCFSDDSATFKKMGEMIFQVSGLAALLQTLKVVFPSLSRLLRTPFIPRPVDQYFRSVVKDVLEAKRNGAPGNDFVHQMWDSHKSENGQVDENFIAGHAMSFFTDGYLTSSYTLTSIAYEIADHPAVQKKLREEVKQVLDAHKGEINYETIQDMKYMDQVMKESMRLLPAFSVLQKRCTQQTKLTGFDGLDCVVMPGDVIDICTFGFQKDPKYWEDPEIFNPDRFNEDFNAEQMKFAFLPFGGGPRACPGMRMAMLQMKGAITILLSNFALEVSPRTKLPFKMESTNFLNYPKGGIWLKIKALSNGQ